LWALIEMQPLADPNVVYDFHFYDPFLFTHQGATWTWDAVVDLRGVPYPSTPENVQPVIDQTAEAEIQDYLRGYGEERWDRARIQENLEPVAQWRDEHQVRVLCGEFGVYGLYAPPADRAQWILDVRTTLETLGLAWAMWEYDDSFGLVKRQADGSVVVDPAIAAALGVGR
jgi:hypothetical protein